MTDRDTLIAEADEVLKVYDAAGGCELREVRILRSLLTLVQFYKQRGDERVAAYERKCLEVEQLTDRLTLVREDGHQLRDGEMSDICVGPNGGCPICYHEPCRCQETDTERQVREVRERRLKKLQTAHGIEVELLDCEACKQHSVVADDVVRAYVCLRCGHQQKPKWTDDRSREDGPQPHIEAERDEAIRLATEATNALACVARRKYQHHEVDRLHRAIDALKSRADVPHHESDQQERQKATSAGETAS
jgi:hypothetical protein